MPRPPMSSRSMSFASDSLPMVSEDQIAEAVERQVRPHLLTFEVRTLLTERMTTLEEQLSARMDDFLSTQTRLDYRIELLERGHRNPAWTSSQNGEGNSCRSSDMLQRLADLSGELVDETDKNIEALACRHEMRLDELVRRKLDALKLRFDERVTGLAQELKDTRLTMSDKVAGATKESKAIQNEQTPKRSEAQRDGTEDPDIRRPSMLSSGSKLEQRIEVVVALSSSATVQQERQQEFAQDIHKVQADVHRQLREFKVSGEMGEELEAVPAFVSESPVQSEHNQEEVDRKLA